MVVIGYDRYNVIVKGITGAKITAGKAAVILLVIWAYSTLGSFPPFFGWGGYSLGINPNLFSYKICQLILNCIDFRGNAYYLLL